MRFGVQRQQTLLVTTELVIWRYANAFTFTNQSELDFVCMYYVYMCGRMYECICVCTYYVCMCVCVWYVCTGICVYVYTYIGTYKFSMNVLNFKPSEGSLMSIHRVLHLLDNKSWNSQEL
jgi:hypothetical protein